MKTTYLTIKLNLNKYLSEEDVMEMSQELDYEIRHRNIATTEIIEIGDLYD